MSANSWPDHGPGPTIPFDNRKRSGVGIVWYHLDHSRNLRWILWHWRGTVESYLIFVHRTQY